ncbi:MAG: YchF/TatD family DNA exonuclease [Chitinivibrionales bacterium]|nr:YchF/TatD family DNA exonuclease [Chitinivibrionales bacterium]MBD3394172.1 YchF/TatD family DNA exonuclease [Chitinivibrionales bacterium]
MWIDAHAHLYDFTDSRLATELEDARQKGVGLIVNAATSLATGLKVAAQCERCPELRATAGISPFDVEGLPDGWIASLEDLLGRKRFVGVGEIGLDDTNPRYPALRAQVPVFEAQLAVARARALPVVVHSRGAEKQAVEACRRTGVPAAVFHCFTGTMDALRMLLDAGFWVSYSGIVTFKRDNLLEQVRYTPVDRLFIETDTPYLAPHPHRGQRNRPAWVSCVGERIAEIKKLPPARLAEHITQSARTVFGITIPW